VKVERPCWTAHTRKSSGSRATITGKRAPTGIPPERRA
jgi:hypothetical protein